MDMVHMLSKCYDYLAMVGVTVLSMVNGNRPLTTSTIELLKVFFQNLSYVILVVVLFKYWELPTELGLVVAYAVGRWSFLLDTKIKEFLTNVSIVDIWREFTTWKK